MKPSEAAARIPSLREQHAVRADLEKLLVDLQELARQINGHIDTRFCKLEVLLQEADAKIKQLESMGFGKDQPATKKNDSSCPEHVDPEKALIYKLADAGKSSVEIAKELNKNTGEIDVRTKMCSRNLLIIIYHLSFQILMP